MWINALTGIGDVAASRPLAALFLRTRAAESDASFDSPTRYSISGDTTSVKTHTLDNDLSSYNYNEFQEEE